ncbi:hypothetical protein K8O68_13340 [Salipaludibacillus sp. CUR1]|uniref:hypothetical protein n=1 Tax=Salipaludibacillus sp. CUR1 TaxID=2820003 RepID=UPI001E5F98E8|nr:hypothetical protein [Salipaludibacillus sp. CUR1]MCE7793406.1 hypothetical protein [Salipaludibacillus sp. CUR1]
MFKVTSIVRMKEEKPLAWNVIFKVDHSVMEYATDIVYAAKRNIWVANSFITHDLSSLMALKQCAFCKEDKIACGVLSREHQEIMNSMVTNEEFLQKLNSILPNVNDLPAAVTIEARKPVWDEILYENFTHKLLLKKRD